MTSLIIQQVLNHVLGYTQSAGNFGALHQQKGGGRGVTVQRPSATNGMS